jgi:hypothetical protein
MSAEVVHRLEVAVCVVAGLWVLARCVGTAEARGP